MFFCPSSWTHGCFDLYLFTCLSLNECFGSDMTLSLWYFDFDSSCGCFNSYLCLTGDLTRARLCFGLRDVLTDFDLMCHCNISIWTLGLVLTLTCSSLVSVLPLTCLCLASVFTHTAESWQDEVSVSAKFTQDLIMWHLSRKVVFMLCKITAVKQSENNILLLWFTLSLHSLSGSANFCVPGLKEGRASVPVVSVTYVIANSWVGLYSLKIWKRTQIVSAFKSVKWYGNNC